MSLDELAAQEQAQSGSRQSRLVVLPAKAGEDALTLVVGNTHAMVAHLDQRLPIPLLSTHTDLNRLSRRAVFHRIIHQMLERLLDQMNINGCEETVCGGPHDERVGMPVLSHSLNHPPHE